MAELFTGLDSPRFFVADASTERFLPEAGPRYILPAGEVSKSWNQLGQLLDSMLSSGLARDSRVIGVGGGVVSDIAGLAASIYMRGCRLTLVPSTLLAMVDAALGGKTGINLGGFKNMVGTFYPADDVRLCAELLHTLPQREYLSGLAEVIKSAMLGDAELFGLLEDERERVAGRDDDLLSEVVWRCVMVKGRIVERDLRESGVRAHLNLGHTFAHALEAEKGLGSWSHGEAVAWGLARAMEAGLLAELTAPDYASRVMALLDAFGYRTDPLPEAAESMLLAMQKDKKRQGGANRFVLQRALGETEVVHLEDDVVRRVLTGEAARG